MRIIKTGIKDLFIVKHKKNIDKRGYLRETYNKKIFGNKKFVFEYCTLSKKNSLRGFHFQLPPFSEKKIITCVKGKLLLVIVNIDKKSNNYLKHLKFILSDNLE